MTHALTAAGYRAALDELGLTQAAAGRLIGVTLRTSQRYAEAGCDGPAALAIRLLLTLPAARRREWLTSEKVSGGR
jgi:hypothetical protein